LTGFQISRFWDTHSVDGNPAWAVYVILIASVTFGALVANFKKSRAKKK